MNDASATRTDRFDWTDFTATLAAEAAYCAPISALYHALFASLEGWSAAIRDQQPLGPHQAILKRAVEESWTGRTFNYRFESVLLLSAAVHACVLSRADLTLRRYYATTGGAFVASQRDELAAALASAFVSMGDDFCGVLRKQRLQTNAVARGVAWLVPYLLLSQHTRRPTALVELGCSAGMNLLSDRYPWRLRTREHALTAPEAEYPISQTLIDDSGLLGAETFRGWDAACALIDARIGCDVNVPRVDNPADLLQLRCCVWGDQTDKLAWLERGVAALGAARRGPNPPRLVEADALSFARDELPALAEQRAPGDLVLVFNTVVTTYIDDPHYQALRAQIEQAFRGPLARQCCAWLELEPLRAGEPAGSEAVLRWHALQQGELRTWRVAELGMHPVEVHFLPALREALAATQARG